MSNPLQFIDYENPTNIVHNRQQFFELLKYSDKLKKSGKFLCDEDSEKYIELMEIFLNNKIDAEDFSFFFIAECDKLNQTLREMEKNFGKNFDELSDLLLEDKKCQLGMSFIWMYDYCDEFDPNSNSLVEVEKNLRNSAEILLSR